MRRVVSCLVVLGFWAGAGWSQPASGSELSEINRSLQQILRALEEQTMRTEAREESRLLLQRLQLQSDRLAPLEDTLAALRLSRTELEQELALATTQQEQARRLSSDSEPGSLAAMMAGPEQRMLELQREQAEEKLAALDARMIEVENEVLVERDRYDTLAARVDARLEIDR